MLVQKSRSKVLSSGRLSLLDLTGLFLLAAVASISFYHPYYFGDELTAFFRPVEDRTFLGIILDLNSYKPRLLFNTIWALYGTLGVPRLVPMAVNALALWGAASVLYFIARDRFNASRIICLLIGGICITSRFGVMLGFDYLSGNIETISALLFFAALYYTLGFIGGNAGKSAHLFAILLLATSAVLVHERYIAATFVLGAAITLDSLLTHRRFLLNGFLGLAIALLPFLTFFLAGQWFSSLALSTGTAGQPVDLGGDTISIAGRYLINVLLGANFGSPWFVGSLNLDRSPGVVIIPAMAFAVISTWVGLVWKARDVTWSRVFLIGGLILALVLVASLPGVEKQESRWMFPVASLLTILVIAIGRATSALLLLLVYLSINLIYFFTGSYRDIFNVEASIEAKNFGRAFSEFASQGEVGLLLDAPQPQTSWWLGGDTVLGNDAESGRMFCRANFNIDSECAVPFSPSVTDIERYDFGLRFAAAPPGGADGPTFTYLGKEDLLASGNLMSSIAEAAAQSGRSSPSVSLVLNPDSVDGCESAAGRGQNVVVSWSVTDPAVETVNVWLVPPQQSPMLFANAAPVGSAETGDWVASQITFVLVDAASNEMLATQRMEAKPCAK